MHFPSIDLEFVHMILGQSHYTPSGDKQYLFEVRPSNVSPLDIDCDHRLAQMIFGQNHDKPSGHMQSLYEVRT